MFPQQPRGDEGKHSVEISPILVWLWMKGINFILTLANTSTWTCHINHLGANSKHKSYLPYYNILLVSEISKT